jgi:uncharacterized membrane protein YgcG
VHHSYHLYIVAIGETTFQRVKNIYANMKNPNDHGVCANYSQVCCTNAPDSLLPDMSEEITFETYVKENGEPGKLEMYLYGSNGKYGSSGDEGGDGNGGGGGGGSDGDDGEGVGQGKLSAAGLL